MAIKYNKATKKFFLTTKNTMYVFQIVHEKFLGHIYYGQKKRGFDPDFYEHNGSFSPYFEEETSSFSLNEAYTEYSYFGSGDFRCTSLRLRNSDGNACTLFFYKSHRIIKGRVPISGMPYAEVKDGDETLEITLTDDVTGCTLKLYYTVMEDCDVITRYMKLENGGEAPVDIENCMSLQVDLPERDYDMISLHGAHCWERQYCRTPVRMGSQTIFSRRGASSHQFNPFMALCKHKATEERGEVFGLNFVYSGNFYAEAELGQAEAVRVQIGLGGENFRWHLLPGETFESPEAIMTYTNKGIGQMSRNFHKFTNDRILPAEIFDKRPVVLNTWEACFFDIDEEKLLEFARVSSECGIDMLVMDDGWFGSRENDWAGLGDWWENPKKFKDGLHAFIDRVKKNNIKFGIWIEPEMVNPDSDLYRAHPEWCLRVPHRPNTLSRHQLVLDMSNSDVVDYLKESFTKTFDGVAIDYIKWDMNRHLSEVGSDFLPPERQLEVAHRFMLGVYELFRWFREKYPNVMIENCSGGGGRYDLGMMKYSSQIWASDLTDPVWRCKIQYGSMLPYPASTMSCHVSHPGSSVKEADYRWAVAIGGMLGYELHIVGADEAIRRRIPEQIAEYRKYEELIKHGDYYRLYSPFETNYNSYYFAAEDNSKILLSFIQLSPDKKEKTIKLKVSRADPHAVYVDERTGDEYTGEELRRGITLTSSLEDRFFRIWSLVRK